MRFESMTASKLAAILSEAAPVRLQGVELLRQFTPTEHSLYPALAQSQRNFARTELVKYKVSAEKLRGKLANLPAIPAPFQVMEFGL